MIAEGILAIQSGETPYAIEEKAERIRGKAGEKRGKEQGRTMRKFEEEQDEGAADWVVSYGDVMSLLLTFFILLFAFSTIDAQKWKEIVLSFKGSTEYTSDAQATGTSLISLDDAAALVHSGKYGRPGHCDP